MNKQAKYYLNEFWEGCKDLALGPEEISPDEEVFIYLLVFVFMIVWAVSIKHQLVSPDYVFSVGGIELPPYL